MYIKGHRAYREYSGNPDNIHLAVDILPALFIENI